MLAICVSTVAIAVVGVGFVLAAVYLAVQDIASPSVAAAATGGLALIITVLFAFVARARMRRETTSPRSSGTSNNAASQSALAAEIGQAAGLQMTSWVKSRPIATTAAALLAGFAVGASPGLRSLLKEIIEPPR